MPPTINDLRVELTKEIDLIDKQVVALAVQLAAAQAQAAEAQALAAEHATKIAGMKAEADAQFKALADQIREVKEKQLWLDRWLIASLLAVILLLVQVAFAPLKTASPTSQQSTPSTGR